MTDISTDNEAIISASERISSAITKVLSTSPQESDPRMLAEGVVRGIPRSRYRECLLYLLIGPVNLELRCRARNIEEAARRSPSGSPRQRAEEAANTLFQQFERLYDSPRLWRTETASSRIYFGYKERQAFRAWCNRDGRGGFSGWLDRAINLHDTAEFREDWVPGYARERAANRLVASVGNIIDRYADEIRFELTSELLESVFATGDGTKVTWGLATVEQHNERVTALTKMVAGTSETAAMHLRAVQMIRAAGVHTLGEIAPPVGAA